MAPLSPNRRPSLFPAFWLSVALHGLLLALPASVIIRPLGPPEAGTAATRLPLRATLLAAPAPAGDSPLSVPESSDLAIAPTASAMAALPIQESPAGQPDSRDALPPAYFPFKALTREPEAINEFQPQLPALPGGAGGRGQLTIRIWINAAGSIDRVELLSGTMTESYRQPVLDAFAKMMFKPGEIGHLPVATWTDVVIDIPGGTP